MPFVHYITLPLLHEMMLTVLRGRRGNSDEHYYLSFVMHNLY